MEKYEILTIEKGEVAIGTLKGEPKPDKGYYEKTMKGALSINPCAMYCPSCSETHEYKYGKVLRKWTLNHGDLNFKLSYKKDTQGNLYASCDSCGFDLRKDVEDFNIVTKPPQKEIFHERYLEGVRYKEGMYWLDYNDFKETLLNIRNGDKIKLCIKQRIGPSTNILTLKESVFKNAKELRAEGDKIGIPRKFWRNN